MAVATDQVAIIAENPVAGVDINCPFPMYDGLEIQVLYGAAGLVAVLDVDYTIALNFPNFEDFIVTPLVALTNKISDLIVADTTGSEVNSITIRRVLPYLTSITPESARQTEFLSREIDRVWCALMQMNENVHRSIVLNPRRIGADSDNFTIPEPSANAAIVWSADATTLVNGPDVGDLPAVEAAAVTAVAASATATTQAGIATVQAAAAAVSAAAALASTFTTGDFKVTAKTVADAGFILLDDGTIGDALSGGTTRANADTAALYSFVWSKYANAQCPIFTSTGVVSARGANAAADYAAHKRLSVPKVLARAMCVAGAGTGLTARALGVIVGEENHILSIAELASHTHVATVDEHGGHSHTSQIGGDGNAGGPQPQRSANHITDNPTTTDLTGITVANASAGSDGGHNNMQPSAFAFNIMMKL